MEDLELLQGTVATVVFQNPENGYAVLRLSCAGQVITVVGTIPLAVPGERLMVTGRWTNNANYGRQFEAEFLERLMPETTPEILSYLSSRTVKGIGPKLASRIVERFGSQTLAVMEREPERLAEVPGITQQKAKQIGKTFLHQTGMRRLIEFLSLHHLPPELAVRLYRLWGDEAMEILCSDPYCLTEPGLDADFGLVDHFAVELGVAADDPKRVEAGLIFELRYNERGGHVFLPVEKLTGATATLLTVAPEAVAQGIERLVEEQRLVRDRLANIDIVYLPELYEDETYVCQRLKAMASATLPEPAHLDDMVHRAEKAGQVEYSPQQRQALRAAALNRILVVTGGPGTGKTTILRGVLDLYDQMKLKVLLTAPTGRAAMRLQEVTGEEASTIHRLLECQPDPATGQLIFTRDADHPLKAHAVIVDETSMVDVALMASLLRALPSGCRLILVGDPDQLPPVGPGFPLSDILRSAAIPAVRLTEIFRQAQQSLIVMNAHRINTGVLPDLRSTDSDFFFLRRRSDEAVAATICELCKTRLPRNMGIPPEAIQVLSPTRKGDTGTVHLNQLLQEQLNPPAPTKKEKKYGLFSFREGDRVMQIRNNYDILWRKTDGTQAGTGIFNGDIGVIQEIDLNGETITIDFDGRRAEYDFDMLRELEPAYAMTVHKSQGSEYQAVILAAWSCAPNLMSRSVLYTAVTRARKLLIIVGREEMIGAMTENQRRSRRYSGLKLRLQQED
ncbi:MAG: ATP-dependent RecD-like DNA helicase [Faecousia sp.]